MIASRTRGSKGRAGLLISGAVVAALICWQSANMIANGKLTGGVAIVALAVAPFAVAAMWRVPIIFPFGMLAAEVPFDALLSVGGAGAMFARLLGYLTFGALALRMVRMRTVLVPPAFVVPWIVYVVWAYVTGFWSPTPDATATFLSQMAQLVLLLLIVAIYPMRAIEMRALPWILMVSGLFAAGLEIGTSHTLYGSRETLAINGIFIDPNHFSANLLLPLAVATSTFLLDRVRWKKLFAVAVIAAICFAVLKTGSRGGTISVGVVLVFAAVRTGRVVQVASLIAGALALSLLDTTVWERFFGGGEGNFGGRGAMWSVGFHILPQYWMFGSGFGSFPAVFDDNYLSVFMRNTPGWDFYAHNLIVQSFVETGLIGVSSVLIAWWMTFRAARFIPKGHELFPLRVASECAMLALFNSALTIDMLWYKYLWIAICFAALVANAARPRFFLSPGRLSRAAFGPPGAANAPIARARRSRPQSGRPAPAGAAAPAPLRRLPPRAIR